MLKRVSCLEVESLLEKQPVNSAKMVVFGTYHPGGNGESGWSEFFLEKNCWWLVWKGDNSHTLGSSEYCLSEGDVKISQNIIMYTLGLPPTH